VVSVFNYFIADVLLMTDSVLQALKTVNWTFSQLKTSEETAIEMNRNIIPQKL